MEHHKASRKASRLGLAVAAGLVVVGLIVVLVSLGVRGLRHWVDGQPRYLTRFGDLILEPPPPAWYRGGAPTFLDRVHQGAHLSDEPFSVLDYDLAMLTSHFKTYAWVEGVDRVRRLPADRYRGARIEVQLRYREPVAVARLPDRTEVLLDREACLLPADDVDRALAGPLVLIDRLPPPPPITPKDFGTVWKEQDSTGSKEQDSRGSIPSPRAAESAKLAAFLKSVLSRNTESGIVPQNLLISYSKYSKNMQGPLIRFALPNQWLLWGAVPGKESPGEPSAEEKWKSLERWVRETKPHTLKYPNFLRFLGSELQIREGEKPSSLAD